MAIRAKGTLLDDVLVPKPGYPSVKLRAPKTDDELWYTVKMLTGVEIPRTKFCFNHSSPFDAFADAYFARDSMVVWLASRGFGGKTYLLALLSYIETIFLGAEVYILGGSGEQSLKVNRYIREFWKRSHAPLTSLDRTTEDGHLYLKNGGSITALKASQTSVRGQHGQRLRLDEVDEMDLAIFEAAQGQTLARDGVAANTVVSSTWQYPDGTFSEVMKRAKQRGWTVREWCYKEASKPYGWLDVVEIARKRREVSEEAFRVEYDLQQPSATGRAIDTSKVAEMFDETLGMFAGDADEECIAEEPEYGGVYATGADWAKERDWTAIITIRMDVQPARVVAFARTARRPWPQMVEMLNTRAKRYPGVVNHDTTGIGDVVDDYLETGGETNGFWLSGKLRSDLLSRYVTAIEHNEIVSPRITYMMTEHEYAKQSDLYGAGHLPDTVCAAALAWAAHHAVSYWPYADETTPEQIVALRRLQHTREVRRSNGLEMGNLNSKDF